MKRPKEFRSPQGIVKNELQTAQLPGPAGLHAVLACLACRAGLPRWLASLASLAALACLAGLPRWLASLASLATLANPLRWPKNR